MDSAFHAAVAMCEVAAVDQLRGRIPRSAFLSPTVRTQLDAPVGIECAGDRILRTWKKALNSMGKLWHKDQRDLIRGVTQALLPGMYGLDWPAHRLRVCKREGFDPRMLRKQCLFTSPRRWGKTTVLAGLVVAYLLAKPRSTQAIFSTGRRASAAILQLCKQLLGTHEEWKQRIIKCNQETLHLRGPPGSDEDDIRIVSSYPSRVDTLKGVGGDVIYCEEAAAMSTQVFLEVVLPLLQMANVALCCISTTLGADNFYTQLMQLRDADTGDYVFWRVIVIPLCADCLAADADECPHLGPNAIPGWKAQAGSKTAEYVRQMCADEELYRRENQGRITEGGRNQAFDPYNVNQLLARTPVTIESMGDKPPFVLICVDPNGGGTAHTALVAMYRAAASGHFVVSVSPSTTPPAPRCSTAPRCCVFAENLCHWNTHFMCVVPQCYHLCRTSQWVPVWPRLGVFHKVEQGPPHLLQPSTRVPHRDRHGSLRRHHGFKHSRCSYPVLCHENRLVQEPTVYNFLRDGHQVCAVPSL